MRRLLAILAVAAIAVVARPPSANAHAFLAQTDPVQGARLLASPDELVFRFSEPVAGESLRVELRRGGEVPVQTGRPQFDEGARVVRVPLPPLDEGVYVFSAQAASAVDGHETAAEAAFAVGDVDAALPAATTSGTGADWLAVVAGWLFFGGTAAATGALVAQVLALPGLGATGRLRWVRGGLVVALGGGAVVDVVAVLPGGRTRELHPRPCGSGCFTQALELPAGEVGLEIAASAPGWNGGRFGAALSWPPPAARPGLFETMLAAMRAAPRVWVSEVVSSDGPPRRPSDRGGAEMTGEQFVSLIPWGGGGVVDVRPMGAEPSRFSFYLPGSRMLFEVRTDAAGRLLEQRAVNPGHEIQTRFRYADS